MRLSSAILIFAIWAGLFIAIQVGITVFQKSSSDHPPQPDPSTKSSVPDSGNAQAPKIRNSINKNILPTRWITQCTGKNPNVGCEVETTLTMGETRQRLISITVRVPPGSNKPAMMLHLPVGLHLPSGVTFQLEDQKPQQLTVQTCDLEGCYAGTAVSPGMLSAMKAGGLLTVSFQNLSRTTIRVPVPLEGFDGAYREIQPTG